jgi:hypothetical protein
MKRKVFRGLLAMVLLMSLIACASFVKTSYVTLNESKDLYYTAMGITADFQAKGIINQAKRDEINKVAKIFKEAHNLAVDALATYQKTSLVADKDKLTTAIAEAISKWAQVAALINAIKAGSIQPTLTK